MAGGAKPVVKVYGKRKRDASPEAPEYVDVGAWWVNDDGKLGGSWSRDVIAIKVRDRSGKVHVVDPAHYFCNLRDDREHVPLEDIKKALDRKRAQESPPANDEPPPDFGDDDIPF